MMGVALMKKQRKCKPVDCFVVMSEVGKGEVRCIVERGSVVFDEERERCLKWVGRWRSVAECVTGLMGMLCEWSV